MTKIQCAEKAFKRYRKLTSLQVAKHSKRINPADVVFQLRKKYGQKAIETVMVYNRLTGEKYAEYRWKL